MNLFLYLQITDLPEGVKFYSPITAYIKEQYPDVILFDFDNHSDTIISSYATKLLADSTNTVLFIESNLDSNLSKLMPFLTNLLDNPEGVKIILSGKNARLGKMISILPHLEIPENTYTIGQIVQFFGKIF